MPRKATAIHCTDEEKQTIEKWANSRTLELRIVERAKITQGCLASKQVIEIAREIGIRPNTVIEWRNRFSRHGIEGLHNKPRSGKPVTYDTAFRDFVIKNLEEDPPKGQANWDGQALASRLGASADAVWRVLRKEGIHLSRQRSWCVSTDPEFTTKAVNIVGLYLNPPENALVISIDGKPSMQALERAKGYACTSSGKIVQGLKSPTRETAR